MNACFNNTIRGALLLLLFGGISFAAQAPRARVTPDQLTNQYRQQELTSRQDEQQILEAKQIRDKLLRDAQDMLQTLQTLAQQATSFSTKMDTLLDSDAGKRLARDGNGFTTYIRLRNDPVVTMDLIALKTDTASALLNRLKLAEEGPDVGFVPSAKVQQEVDALHLWAKAKLQLLDTRNATLDTIVRKAPQDINLAQTKTLRRAVEEEKARWDLLVSENEESGRKLAAPDVNDTLLFAAYRAQLERARAEAARTRDEMQAQIEKLNQDFEIALLRQRQQAADELSAARRQYEDKLAQIQRNEKDAQTDRAIQDRTAALGRDAKLAVMDREERVALAKSPEVQQLLAPFITPGYWQPRQGRPSYDKMPVSRNQLKAYGALRQTPAGLKALLDIGMAPGDKERPRWPFRARYVDLTADEHEQIRQAQEYLIQLGDILEELGMLSK
jgi:hypothetical protein